MTQIQHDKYLKYAILLNAVPGAKLNPDLHRAHAEHLRMLDDEGKLVIAGPYVEHNSGIIIVSAGSREEAIKIAESDPFVAQGYRGYEVRTLEVCCRENNFRKPE